MKFGLLVNAVVTDGAICHYDMCRKLKAMGHTAAFYGRDFKGNTDGVTTIKITGAEIESSQWWKDQALERVLFYGTNRFPPSVLKAAREAGIRTILECDSDGYISPRQNPIRLLRVYMWDPSYTLRHKAGILKVWLQELVTKSAAREAELFEILELAHHIKIESDEPAKLVCEFLRRRNKAHLIEKVTVIPFAVRDIFVTQPVNREREDLIIIAGRIGAQQKNPGLLEKVLRRFVELSPTTKVEMHVRGEAPNLEAWAGSYPRAQLFKQTTPQVLCQRLLSARVLLSTSRFESTPIQGLEALCQGCTIVASDDVPGYRSFIHDQAYGETFKNDSAEDCAAAIHREMERWSKGTRDPSVIAEHWRSYCSLEAVNNSLLALGSKPVAR